MSADVDAGGLMVAGGPPPYEHWEVSSAGLDSEPVSGGWPQIIYALTFTLSHDIVRVTSSDLWLVRVISAEEKGSDRSLGG